MANSVKNSIERLKGLIGQLQGIIDNTPAPSPSRPSPSPAPSPSPSPSANNVARNAAVAAAAVEAKRVAEAAAAAAAAEAARRNAEAAAAAALATNNAAKRAEAERKAAEARKAAEEAAAAEAVAEVARKTETAIADATKRATEAAAAAERAAKEVERLLAEMKIQNEAKQAAKNADGKRNANTKLSRLQAQLKGAQEAAREAEAAKEKAERALAELQQRMKAVAPAPSKPSVPVQPQPAPVQLQLQPNSFEDKAATPLHLAVGPHHTNREQRELNEVKAALPGHNKIAKLNEEAAKVRPEVEPNDPRHVEVRRQAQNAHRRENAIAHAILEEKALKRAGPLHEQAIQCKVPTYKKQNPEICKKFNIERPHSAPQRKGPAPSVLGRRYSIGGNRKTRRSHKRKGTRRYRS